MSLVAEVGGSLVVDDRSLAAQVGGALAADDRPLAAQVRGASSAEQQYTMQRYIDESSTISVADEMMLKYDNAVAQVRDV